MATTIGLQVGAVTAWRTYQDDAHAAALLLAIYEGAGLGPADAANQQKLLAVTDYIVGMIQAEAYRFLLAKKQATALAAQLDEAKTESTLK